MPLVTPKEMFQKAYAGGYAIGAFNVNNMEIIQGIMAAGQEERAPLILQVSAGARKYAQQIYIIKLMEAAMSLTDLPVVLHLDHGQNFEICKEVIDGGFTSVMIDGSHLPFEENIAETKKVVAYAHSNGVWVEAELGRLAGVEDEVSSEHSIYTDPDQAAEFVGKTGCDSLAIAIGTSHGAYKGKGRPYIDHKRLEEISQRVSIPLVLHGASGVPTWLKEKLLATGAELKEATGIHDEDIKKAIPNGIAKINIDTDLRLAMTLGIREVVVGNPKEFDPRKIIGKGRDYLKQVIREKFELMGTVGRA
ncbi:MAG TPA: fructose-1,6-bisphosphate aldolase, class II [Thermus scotoductus]|nr:fructose-1,6-bisphosphate aldolase, class II [Thermus scotoductus]